MRAKTCEQLLYIKRQGSQALPRSCHQSSAPASNALPAPQSTSASHRTSMAAAAQSSEARHQGEVATRCISNLAGRAPRGGSGEPREAGGCRAAAAGAGRPGVPVPARAAAARLVRRATCGGAGVRSVDHSARSLAGFYSAGPAARCPSHCPIIVLSQPRETDAGDAKERDVNDRSHSRYSNKHDLQAQISREVL